MKHKWKGNGIRAVPLFFVKSLAERWKDILIAFTAGIMVSASSGLMPQAIEESGMTVLIIGLMIGVVVLDIIEKIFPILTLKMILKHIHLTQRRCW